MTITPFIPPLNVSVRYYPLAVRRYVIGEVLNLHGAEYVVTGRSIAGGQPYILLAEYHPPIRSAA